MLFPTRKTALQAPQVHVRKDFGADRRPNLEMLSSSHLHRYTEYLLASFGELEKENTIEAVVSNRKRFLLVYTDMRREATLYLDGDGISLLRVAQSLNMEHRTVCLRMLAKLKNAPNPSLESMPCEIPAQSGTNDLDLQSTNNPRVRRELKLHYTNILKKWIDDHAAHPFPSKKEKSELCKEASITERQLNNWFTNYRRRHRPQE
ncbi:hypothetical protein BC939DRAFT_441761 [Gamsiella multidivaricata]|uniref:uncharacterized protein n=1 Tax=Gamsiella multidivaricata TaxID=101098 RepID=UPI00221F33D6|nr:uncharacterized protein BC939DRAFT_441761 [Gamsiella multidivaricata]KAI7829392.1 hypothetical protein BC939DRAFT_441761 [Gamsiella multidivaricata]